MRERGLPDIESSRKGDQMVRVHVWTPTKLTDSERAVVEKLRDAEHFQPDPDSLGDRKGFFSRVKDVFS
jgi:molecular chaperone DnaJ